MQPEQVKSPVYYLAGPMSGISQSNFPKFDAVAFELRMAGYQIVSPAELDDPVIRKAALNNEPMPNGETWGDFLARDVKIVADAVDGVVVMDGWEKSRGARLEVFVANLTGLGIFVYQGQGIMRPMGEHEYLHGILDSPTVLGGSDYGRRR